MQLGSGNNMRVRNSPFGATAANAVAADASDDFFSGGWEESIPEAKPAPRAPMAVSAPQMAGPGILPPQSMAGVMPPQSGPGVMSPAHAQQQWAPPVQQQQQQQQQQQPQQQQQQQQWAPPAPQQQQQQQPQQQQAFFQQTQAPVFQQTQALQQPMGMQGQQSPQMQMPQVGNMFAAGMAAAAGGGDFNQAMANAALSQAQGIAGQGMSRWFPYLMAGLQGQFNVGHGFVLRKLRLLLCPFIQFSGGAPSGFDSGDHTPGGTMHKDPSTTGEFLKTDINEPDLYIPFMGYMTYCVVYCIQRAFLDEFKIEVLAGTFSFAMVLYILEVVVAKMGFFIAGSQVSFLELMGTCGYKFVHVFLMVLIRIVIGSSYFYYAFFAYFAAASGFALRRFMNNAPPTPHQQQYGVPPSALHNNLILGLAIAQIPLCWLLTPNAQSKIVAAAVGGAGTLGAAAVGAAGAAAGGNF